MSPDAHHPHMISFKSQQGSMLVIAIFIIVVLGILLSALASILSSSQQSVNYEVLGVRAQAAANAGLDAGLYRILRQSSSCNVMASGSTMPTTMLSVALDVSSTGLSQCTVAVFCGQRPAVSGSTAIYFILNSTGTCIAGNNKLTATRVIKSEVKK
jgi:hypothetical protein